MFIFLPVYIISTLCTVDNMDTTLGLLFDLSFKALNLHANIFLPFCGLQNTAVPGQDHLVLVQNSFD